MKKRSFLALAALCLSGTGSVQAQTDGKSWFPKEINPKALLKVLNNRCSNNPDPSYINGYMAFEDPATGETWVPNNELEGGQTQWVVNYDVIFRSRTNPEETFTAPARNGAGIMTTNSTGIIYVVRLNADRNAGAPSGREARNFVVRYNPDQWCFDRIEVHPHINQHGFNNLQQRSSNFPTLPDRPICRTDGICMTR
ncbi:hypothetical protein [Sphingorhabdus sp.]|jgi:hypothetical protein|uniref:hypothetical protein n=1 Tax=Sphingorhabdus sp. TaxID=1902408 RepID=UPI003BB06BD4|nr:hypothetical protein [Sphingomonadales bacterium]MBL0022973.1 hypothetical protein [Sphingomonadales bacterium]